MDIQETVNTYSDLMALIKSRLNILKDLTDNHRHYPGWAVIELTQLQIRLVCETFAAACHVAHGDLPGTRTSEMREAYRADFLIKKLEKLHPYFYPQPTRQVLASGQPTGWEGASPATDYLTKKQLLESYHAADTILHMGNLRGAVNRTKMKFDYSATINFHNRTIALLNHHNIYLADEPEPGEKLLIRDDGIPIPKRQLVTAMQTTDGGRVQTSLFQRAGSVTLRDGHASP